MRGPFLIQDHVLISLLNAISKLPKLDFFFFEACRVHNMTPSFEKAHFETLQIITLIFNIVFIVFRDFYFYYSFYINTPEEYIYIRVGRKK